MIHIIDGWYIEALPLEYTAFILVNGKKSTYRKEQSYHPTLERAIKYVMKHNERNIIKQFSGEIIDCLKRLEDVEEKIYKQLFDNVRGYYC